MTSLPTGSAAPFSSSKRPKVLVSILNWNGAHKTLHCLTSIKDEQATTSMVADVTVLVIDNGSRPDDLAQLQAGIPAFVTLKTVPGNLGFTGGHNIAIASAIAEGYDFIWLLNNDAEVVPGTLLQLVNEIMRDSRTGAVSPVLRDSADRSTVMRCVNTHNWIDWESNRIVAFDEARRLQDQEPASVWLDGTAILFRVKALEQTGPLDDRLFAYYDDDDIGTRLARKGWHSRCVFDATVYHDVRRTYEEYPPYLVYLLHRNHMLFYYKHTPAAYRRMLYLRLVDKALFEANRRGDRGLPAQRDMMLLATEDFLRGRFGPPKLDRKVAWWISALAGMSARRNRQKLDALRVNRS
jgi:GT2 family glycosyltransferase